MTLSAIAGATTLVTPERKWWEEYLDHPTASARMVALYGQRYGDFFYEEFRNAGNTVEIGSGPVPVMQVMECRNMVAVDIDDYKGLTQWPILTDPHELNGNNWDTVLLLNVLDHCQEPQALVDEALRLLRPGGKCLVFCHYGQDEDGMHQSLTLAQIESWFSGFDRIRYQVGQPVGDPPAYWAVYQKEMQHPRQVLAEAYAALNEVCTPFLACGSLLVAVRGDGFLPWEYDFDFGVFMAPGMRDRIVKAMQDAGYVLWREFDEDGEVLQFTRHDSRYVIDVYGYYRDGETVWQSIYKNDKPAGRYVYQSFSGFETTYWLGTKVLIPTDAESILESHYGDWRTVRREWDWSRDPLCLR